MLGLLVKCKIQAAALDDNKTNRFLFGSQGINARVLITITMSTKRKGCCRTAKSSETEGRDGDGGNR